MRYREEIGKNRNSEIGNKDYFLPVKLNIL